MCYGDLRDPRLNAASQYPPSAYTGGEADSTLSSIFSFTHHLTLHWAIVDIQEIFIDYNIALFPGNFMLTHISLT